MHICSGWFRLKLARFAAASGKLLSRSVFLATHLRV
tara:strand:+ start:4225 stop:4332 length:108 start_codon:yes stop_codon:yes gene_type:complete